MQNFSALLEQAPEPPEVGEAKLEELEDSDPETYVLVSVAKAHPPKPVNLGGNGRLTLTRPDRGEKVTARYRRKDGSYDQEEIKKLQWIMRSGGSGEQTPPSLLLLEILDAVEDRFGGKGLELLSGYRTPRFNSKVPGAARWSMHMLGWAADIRVPGRATLKVARYAYGLRAGGVGYYPDAAFVHVDAGRHRHWTVRRPPQQAAAKEH
jgi:uncharacterized protein YcbK (DUF882 family)